MTLIDRLVTLKKMTREDDSLENTFHEIMGKGFQWKTITDNEELMALDMQLALCNKRMDGPTGKVNHILRIAYGYQRFITQCHDDVVNGYAEDLTVKDTADNPNGKEARPGKMLPYCENAYGEGLHESIQNYVFAYMPNFHPRDLSPIMRSLTALGSLAGRISRHTPRTMGIGPWNKGEYNYASRMWDMETANKKAVSYLHAMRALDPDMWEIGVEDKGKQWLNGMAAYSLEIDACKQVTGSVDGGYSREIHKNGQPWVKETANSNCVFTHSISERDITAE